MAKYMLQRGISRLPIDGVRVIPREGLPPIRQGETILFVAGEVVESDLDFRSWVDEGVLIRIRESNDPPRPPKAAPSEAPKKQILTPMPEFVKVDVVEDKPGEEKKEEPVSEPETKDEGEEKEESSSRPTRRTRR